MQRGQIGALKELTDRNLIPQINDFSMAATQSAGMRRLLVRPSIKADASRARS